MISDRIEQLRIENRMTQKQLAALLEVSQATISKYEGGKRSPDLHILCRICHVFGVSMDYLLGLSEIRKQADSLLDGNDRMLLSMYRSLTDTQKEQGSVYIRMLIQR